MKTRLLTLLLIWLLRLTTWGQSAAVVQLGNLSEKGIVLDTGWTWQAGDESGWAGPSYNDRQWSPINPAQSIHSLNRIRQAGIGWFRLRLQVDTSLVGKPLALLVSQTGASEIYLNGHLITRLGTVSPNPHTEKARFITNQPVAVSFSQAGEQVIAVRYSFTAPNFYVFFPMDGYALWCLRVSLLPHEAAVTSYSRFLHLILIPAALKAGITLMLALFHLFLYFGYPGQRAHLPFGISMLLYSPWLIGPTLLYESTLTVSQAFGLFWLLYGFVAIAGILGTLALYQVFNRPTDFFFRTLILGYMLATLSMPVYGLGFVLAFFTTLYQVGLSLQTALKGVRQGQSEGRIVAINSIIWMICLVLAALSPYFSDNPVLAVVFRAGFDLLSPVSFSAILAAEYARTSRTLQIKLAEVETLSKKTISQEQEKQQILAQHNETLERQVVNRTQQLQASLDELKKAQTQLIHHEKMASLGELTAGIAHEIQNPLNFVNNLTEVSQELVGELKEEEDKANPDPTLRKELLIDLEESLQKITHHGKRADSIVKGMLQHSRSSSGEKQPTDLNKLAEEYLRLAYQGLRAKDKSFNADLRLNLDPNLKLVNVAPQEIGRVLLNIYNNAFYATQEKLKQTGKAGIVLDYQPQIEITTHKGNGQVELRIKDNGTGISPEVINKIYQPFFTTKPTGQGTGLGLSLSYDIVTKGHGGEMRVESTPGEFTEFVVSIPS
ncbi:hypothetical protein GCM10023189_46070 [Nibrella saemangeumensis]|uniref:histidine kinase n=1 Tax=Nibrella saemangeumensis TaxID=1084526 RepID=A0ABP8NHH7_9BACT